MYFLNKTLIKERKVGRKKKVVGKAGKKRLGLVKSYIGFVN